MFFCSSFWGKKGWGGVVRSPSGWLCRSVGVPIENYPKTTTIPSLLVQTLLLLLFVSFFSAKARYAIRKNGRRFNHNPLRWLDGCLFMSVSYYLWEETMCRFSTPSYLWRKTWGSVPASPLWLRHFRSWHSFLPIPLVAFDGTSLWRAFFFFFNLHS